MSDIRVLVVEDEPVASAAHAAYVGRMAGFTLAGTAPDGQSALRLLTELSASGEPVELVLLDMNLPDLHGLDIDIIHAHYWLSGMVGLQLAREFRAPLILSMHTSAAAKEFESGIPEPGPRKQAEKQLLAEASRIIANTPVEARQLADWIVAEKLPVRFQTQLHKLLWNDEPGR